VKASALPTHGYHKEVTPSTCYAYGYTICTCGDCGFTYKEYDNHLLPHGWNYALDEGWEDYVPATETTEGSEIRRCVNSGCGAYEMRKTGTLKHTHVYDDGEPHDVTCTEDGFTRYSCCGCDYFIDIVTATKLGHDWQEISREEYCTFRGSVEYICKRCGETETRETEPTGIHNHVRTDGRDSTCKEEGFEIRTCRYCQDTIREDYEKLPHIWTDEWVVTKQPGATMGEKTRYCANGCGEEETMSIPVLCSEDSGLTIEDPTGQLDAGTELIVERFDDPERAHNYNVGKGMNMVYAYDIVLMKPNGEKQTEFDLPLRVRLVLPEDDFPAGSFIVVNHFPDSDPGNCDFTLEVGEGLDVKREGKWVILEFGSKYFIVYAIFTMQSGPSAPKWWESPPLPYWVHWLLRWLCFGWLWMK
jgi:hypothetical protein